MDSLNRFAMTFLIFVTGISVNLGLRPRASSTGAAADTGAFAAAGGGGTDFGAFAKARIDSGITGPDFGTKNRKSAQIFCR